MINGYLWTSEQKKMVKKYVDGPRLLSLYTLDTYATPNYCRRPCVSMRFCHCWSLCNSQKRVYFDFDFINVVVVSIFRLWYDPFRFISNNDNGHYDRAKYAHKQSIKTNQISSAPFPFQLTIIISNRSISSVTHRIIRKIFVNLL